MPLLALRQGAALTITDARAFAHAPASPLAAALADATPSLTRLQTVAQLVQSVLLHSAKDLADIRIGLNEPLERIVLRPVGQGQGGDVGIEARPIRGIGLRLVVGLGFGRFDRLGSLANALARTMAAAFAAASAAVEADHINRHRAAGLAEAQPAQPGQQDQHRNAQEVQGERTDGRERQLLVLRVALPDRLFGRDADWFWCGGGLVGCCGHG